MKINEKQIDTIWEQLKKDPSKTLYLEEICEILYLSIKNDGDVIFKILGDNVFFEHDENAISIRGLSHQFTWKINMEGFQTLCNYALHREQYLMTFHKLFYSDLKREQSLKNQSKEKNDANQ